MRTSEDYIVVETDIDSLGHMNFLRYVALYSDFRLQWLANIGLDKSARMAAKLGAVVLHFDIDYHREIRLGETVTITTELKRKGNKSFTLYQTIFSKEQLHSETTVVLAIMDLNLRKAIPLPAEIKNINIIETKNHEIKN